MWGYTKGARILNIYRDKLSDGSTAVYESWCIGALLYVESLTEHFFFDIFAVEDERHFKLSIFLVIFCLTLFSPGEGGWQISC